MSESDFVWKSEYDTVIREIASTDTVSTAWPMLRNIITHKIKQNVTMFLSDYKQPRPPTRFTPQHLPSGGLKLPPFPPRKREAHTMIEPSVLAPRAIEAPVSYMTEQQASDMIRVIVEQLRGFEDFPPFTIQRVCELCLHPTQQYKSVGKYLRAVEKSLLVTSTIDAFPPLTEKEKDLFAGPTVTLGASPRSTPSTPLFSPIPFLHEDARRSRSQSPPPSPLVLGASIASEPKALGLVDELDDPRPGHLSDSPIPLSSTTRPIFATLEERFVRVDGSVGRQSEEEMILDDADDKENKS